MAGMRSTRRVAALLGTSLVVFLTALVTTAGHRGHAGAAASDDLDALARDFWAWRARTQPFNRDDISRIERPAGWSPGWSAAAMAERRRALEAFDTRWKALDASSWPVPRQVDYRLIRSAVPPRRRGPAQTRPWPP